MLFKTIAEIKAHASAFAKNMEWATLAPHVEQAESKFIVPLLGRAQYDALTTAYQNATLSVAQAALLRYAQRALAYYTLYEALPFLSLIVSDMGVQEQQSREGTSAPARTTVSKIARDQALQNADQAADAMLTFMEENDTDYPLWAGSLAFTKTKELFINNATEYSKWLNISDSKRLFLALRPYLEIAEEEYIRPAIGDDMYNDLKAKMADILTTPLSAAYTSILPRIQRPLAHWAMYKAMPFLAVQVSPSGISVSSVTDGNETRTAADRDRYATMLSAAQQTAMTFTQLLRKYIDDHIEDFPLYEGDPERLDQPRYQLPNNSGKRSFIV